MRLFCLILPLAVLGLNRPACAQMAVLDASSLVQLQQSVNTATNQLKLLQQQYSQLTNVYSALAHPTDAGSTAPTLGLPSVQNPLGGVGQLPGAMSGTGSLSTSPLSQQLLFSNRTYQPPGSDAVAQGLNQQAQGTANIQAIAYQNLLATQKRLAVLPQLQSEINSARSVQDVGALQARLQVEQQFIQTQQAQAQNLSLLQKAQEDIARQQDEQRDRQAADQLVQDTQPLP